MKQNRQLLTLILISFCFGVYGQQSHFNKQENFLKANSVWALGIKNGLDFNSGVPVPILSEIDTWEGYASAADPDSGKLLFYSNGGKCWNANNMVMPNGDSLFGNSLRSNGFYASNATNGGYTTTQGVCIVPVINSTGKYYLFSLNGQGQTPSLYYSIVDMSLDNGLGDVVPGQKNIVLDRDSLRESMIAIPGDDCDIWLMVYAFNKPDFKAYHITADGIDTVPVRSRTQQEYGRFYSFQGAMAVSSDRRKIALASNNGFAIDQGVYIGNFDASTGYVTDIIKISDRLSYCLCFSPDNSKLYTNYSFAASAIYQFDISVHDSIAIRGSMDTVWLANPNAPNSARESSAWLRLYKDTIYLTAHAGGGQNPVSNISIIAQPNLSGVACDFRFASISFPQGKVLGSNLGNDLVYPIQKKRGISFLDTVLCSGTTMNLHAQPSAKGDYRWDDGSMEQTRLIDKGGLYWVAYEANECEYRIDTFYINEIDLSPMITVNVHQLGTTMAYNTYQWLLNGKVIPQAEKRNYLVKENGDYQVVVSNENGCIDTSDIYKVTNALGIDDIYAADSLFIYPNPTNGLVYIQSSIPVNSAVYSIDGKLIKSFHKSNLISLNGLNSGIYFLRIYDLNHNLQKVKKLIYSK